MCSKRLAGAVHRAVAKCRTDIEIKIQMTSEIPRKGKNKQAKNKSIKNTF